MSDKVGCQAIELPKSGGGSGKLVENCAHKKRLPAGKLVMIGAQERNSALLPGDGFRLGCPCLPLIALICHPAYHI